MKAAPFFLALMLIAGCASAPKEPELTWPQFRLQAGQVTRLNLPDGKRQFDASGLLRLRSGELLTLGNNLGPQLYRIEFLPDATEARLVSTEWFTSARVTVDLGMKPSQLDCEGIAQDGGGRIYICEEKNRWILACSAETGSVERLPIDWAPVKSFFNALDPNASFEGVAVGKGVLYVANERSAPRIVMVDLKRLKVSGQFEIQPRASSFFGTHYSDLCWFEGKLWVLCRQHRVVLAVDPKTQRVLAEFDYRELEDDLGYRTILPIPVGIMEGLAVDRDSIWLLTDNNGMGRANAPQDLRPTLIRCRRPDLPSK